VYRLRGELGIEWSLESDRIGVGSEVCNFYQSGSDPSVIFFQNWIRNAILKLGNSLSHLKKNFFNVFVFALAVSSQHNLTYWDSWF